MRSSRAAGIDAVTIDAFGTLVELSDPAGRLGEALARRGFSRAPDEVRAAFAAEVEYYLVHKVEGSEAESLADLRRRCAGVFLEHARAELDPQDFAPVFVQALVFRPLGGVVETLSSLRASGLALACVTNWDIGIGEQLERAGLARYLDAVVSSAEVGAEKPDPRVFTEALARLGVEAERALHVGDEEGDADGAAAAGMAFAAAPLATLPARLGL